MDFSSVLSVASQNKRHAEKGSKVKRYTTEVSAPKKLPKSNVPSDAVKAFLARKANEVKSRGIEAEKQRRELLELRSEAKNKRKANAMTRRTKDNNFMAGFLMKPEDRIAPEETIKCTEKERDKLGAKTPSVAPSGRILKGDKRWVEVARNNNAQPAMEPKPKFKPPSAPSNYHDLLKLAYHKQFIPTDEPFPKKKEVVQATERNEGASGDMRLMRKKEKQRYLEEQAHRSGKPLPSPPQTAKGKNVSAKKPEAEFGRIPNLKGAATAFGGPTKRTEMARKSAPVPQVMSAAKTVRSEQPKGKVSVAERKPAVQSSARIQGGNANNAGNVKRAVPLPRPGALKPKGSEVSQPGPVPSRTAQALNDKKAMPSKPVERKSVGTVAKEKFNSNGDLRKRDSQQHIKPQASMSSISSRPTAGLQRIAVDIKPKERLSGGKPPVPVKARPFPPVESRQFPPRDMMRQPPPPPRPLKRRIESDEEDDMDGFIDDTPLPDSEDYSKHIRDIFGYDRRKYQFNAEEEEEEAKYMESSFVEQMREEARSARLGLLEDLEDIQREEEELQRELSRRKKKKK